MLVLARGPAGKQQQADSHKIVAALFPSLPIVGLLQESRYSMVVASVLTVNPAAVFAFIHDLF